MSILLSGPEKEKEKKSNLFPLYFVEIKLINYGISNK
jgi:hypothetical protein